MTQCGCKPPKFNLVNERRRTYVYPDGGKIEFTDVKGVAVSERGTHRLNCAEGKIIVVPGWRYIALDMDEWSF